jgi:beta-glucosidase
MTINRPYSSAQTAEHPKVRAEALVAQMTLAEKIGQMTQVEKNSITPEQTTRYFIGSVLSGGGGNPSPNTPASWAAMVREYQRAALQTRLRIPLLYGADAVHGHNNVHGAVIFPHNIGLGATHDPELVSKVARITALEMLATGVHWDFAPAVAVPQDIRWGRTFEGYAQDTALVTEMGLAHIRGLQSVDGEPPLAHPQAVLASPKHFVGDGATEWGSTPRFPWMQRERSEIDQIYMLDQGDTKIDEPTLRAIHLPPYRAAIEAGCQNIMVSFSGWQGVKMHAHKYLLTDVLKGEFGFEGFLVSDWMAINQIAGDFYECVVTSINAGLDMIMVPFDFQHFISALTRAAQNGDVPMDRIDDAVRRIVSVKAQMGLFESPYGDESLLAEFGSEKHRAVAREAVQKSLVLLKNDANTLPLPRQANRILVAGKAADDIGLQCGGWTIEWQGGSGPTTEGTTLLQAIRATAVPDTHVEFSASGSFAIDNPAPIGIVAVSEKPYAEGMGDTDKLILSPENFDLIAQMRARCERLIVVLYSGRPLIITEMLPLADAVVAAWLPGSEGQGIADVLFGDVPFSGKLSFVWPRSMAQVPLSAIRDDTPLFPIGYRLTYP